MRLPRPRIRPKLPVRMAAGARPAGQEPPPGPEPAARLPGYSRGVGSGRPSAWRPERPVAALVAAAAPTEVAALVAAAAPAEAAAPGPQQRAVAEPPVPVPVPAAS